MSTQKPEPVQLPLGWLAPGVMLVSLLINYNIASVDRLKLDQFAPVPIFARHVASYSPNTVAQAFPAVNPQLFDQVLEDQGQQPQGSQFQENGQSEPGSTAPSATPPAAATPTPGGSQPTPGNDAGGLLPSIQITLPAVLPTQIVPILETLIPAPTEGVLQPIATLLPVCIPLPPLIRCP